MSRSPLDRATLCNIFLPALVVVTLESCYSRGSPYMLLLVAADCWLQDKVLAAKIARGMQTPAPLKRGDDGRCVREY